MFCCGKLLYGAIPCAFGVSSKCADVVGDTTLQVAKVDENIIVSFRRYRFGVLQSRFGICAAVADPFFRYFQSAISRNGSFHFGTILRQVVYSGLCHGRCECSFCIELNVTAVERTVTGDGVGAGMISISFRQSGDSGCYFLLGAAVRNFTPFYGRIGIFAVANTLLLDNAFRFVGHQ